MAKEEPKVETETPPPAPESAVEAAIEAPPSEVKSIVPAAPVEEDKPDESKAIVLAEKVPEAVEEKPASEGSISRDAALARVATEKRVSFVRAWEESEKSKAENKAEKKISTVTSWENTKKAAIEAELKKIEEKLEKQKAAYIEKTQNKIAMIHKQAEEKRAIIESQRGEELLKAEELAAKFRATGTAPKKLYGCF